jgi:hypothetical protein
MVLDLNAEFIPVNAILCVISFILGFMLCYHRFTKSIDENNKIQIEKAKLIPGPLSLDPMVFQFHLLENTEYALSVTGMEGKHLIQSNHKKFMAILKYLYENEKLRPFPKQHEFKLLTFERKE